MIEEAIDQNQTTKQTENYPEIGSSSGQDSNESGQSPSSSLKRMDRETKKSYTVGWDLESFYHACL